MASAAHGEETEAQAGDVAAPESENGSAAGKSSGRASLLREGVSLWLVDLFGEEETPVG